MKIQVLVSTMFRQNYDLLDKMRIQSDAVIINQCNDKFSINEFNKNQMNFKWINTPDRGLSKSRNVALNYATCDICLLADDDLEYLDNYHEIILEQFDFYPEADVIAFQVEGIEEIHKTYYPKKRNINFLTAMKISSVEIAFRLNKIKYANLIFNEDFGSGAEFFMGEENIFLANCLRSKLKIVYVPIKIANLHIGNSTWFSGFNRPYFISKGAAFTAMSKKFAFLLIIQFAIRKYYLFKNSVSFFDSILYMLEGSNKYLHKV